jgi:hypothetical protein
MSDKILWKDIPTNNYGKKFVATKIISDGYVNNIEMSEFEFVKSNLTRSIRACKAVIEGKGWMKLNKGQRLQIKQNLKKGQGRFKTLTGYKYRHDSAFCDKGGTTNKTKQDIVKAKFFNSQHSGKAETYSQDELEGLARPHIMRPDKKDNNMKYVHPKTIKAGSIYHTSGYKGKQVTGA